jgi:hypothetical protein
VFLALGAIFGPKVAEYLHLPALELRLIWLLALALVCPVVGKAAFCAPATAPRSTWPAASTATSLLQTIWKSRPTSSRLTARWLPSA